MQSRKFLLLVGLSATLTLSPTSSFAAPSLDDAKAAYNRSDFQKSCEILSALVATTEKKNATAQYLLANSLVRCARLEDALAAYKQALSLNPDQQLRKYCQAGVATCTKANVKPGAGYVGIGFADSTVDKVFANSPAMLAGIKTGDKIISVNGEKTIALTTERIGNLLAGPIGTHVKLEIERNQVFLSFDLTRSVCPPELFKEQQSMNARIAAYKKLDASARKIYHFSGSDDETEPTSESASVAQAPVHADAEDIAIVKIHRRTADTSYIYDEVLRALHTIPKQVKRDLIDSGCSILICPSVNEAMPENSQDKPRGYTNGGGQDNVFGQFMPSKKTILIAEKAAYNNSAPFRNPDVFHTTLHELGHAYDFSKSISGIPPYSTAYAHDTAKLTNSQRSEISYFVQEGTAGAQESFAELFMLACASSGRRSRDSEQLKGILSESYAYVKMRLGVL